MLPSNPRIGLPSNPRSHSVGRPGQEGRSLFDSSQPTVPSLSTRQIQLQRSLVSFPRNRSRPPLTHASRDSPGHANNSRTEDEQPGSGMDHKSNDSTPSSFSHRMMVGTGYQPSRTSFEDDGRASVPKSPSEERTITLTGRKSVTDEPSRGDGYAVWSRVAAVASTLTVSVSKAWATNIITFAGEDTPLGQESRLTRAMKAYHLEKARDPTDLPPWLFEEHERRSLVSEPRSTSRRREGERAAPKVTFAEMPRSRGPREIYDTAASWDDEGTTDAALQPSKGANRLKAMRDAKRTAQGTNSHPISEQNDDGSKNQARRRGRPPGQDRRTPWVGLPSGPTMGDRRA